MSDNLNGARIRALHNFYGLDEGTEGTIIYIDDPSLPDDVAEYALPGEFAIRYDGVDEWWYAFPSEEGSTWQRI